MAVLAEEPGGHGSNSAHAAWGAAVLYWFQVGICLPVFFVSKEEEEGEEEEDDEDDDKDDDDEFNDAACLSLRCANRLLYYYYQPTHPPTHRPTNQPTNQPTNLSSGFTAAPRPPLSGARGRGRRRRTPSSAGVSPASPATRAPTSNWPSCGSTAATTPGLFALWRPSCASTATVSVESGSQGVEWLIV